MGLIRKSLALGTVGVVRPNSKKQRVAKAQLKELKKQTKAIESAVGDSAAEARGQAALARSRQLQAEAKATTAAGDPIVELPVEGWYPDPDRDHLLRWWDGSDWTERTAPRSR